MYGYCKIKSNKISEEKKSDIVKNVNESPASHDQGIKVSYQMSLGQ